MQAVGLEGWCPRPDGRHGEESRKFSRAPGSSPLGFGAHIGRLDGRQDGRLDGRPDGRLDGRHDGRPDGRHRRHRHRRHRHRQRHPSYRREAGHEFFREEC